MKKSSTPGSADTSDPPRSAAGPTPLLDVVNLSVRYATGRGQSRALEGVDLRLESGANLGLVGESGCGKSTFLKAVLGVLSNNAEITSGQVLFEGRDLRALDHESLRRVRWAGISMITQSALNSLDPVRRVGDQIVDAILSHEACSRSTAQKRAAEAFELVGIDVARMREYPHQFSGGMRQRAIIAMALILKPRLVLADEPTTSLDVIVQDQILQRIRRLQSRLGFSMLLVTHDLALIIENCDQVAVMYGGVVVEHGSVTGVIDAPFHPYTLGLKNSLPHLRRRTAPISIPGVPPDLTALPDGCRFASRCPFVKAVCRRQAPGPVEVEAGHMVRCHRHDEMPALRAEAATVEAWKRVEEAQAAEARL